MSARVLDWLSDSANFFVALLGSGCIIVIVMGLMWLAEHNAVLHNHLWSYNFQLSPADECVPRQWDCALSDELEATWICVPRRDDD